MDELRFREILETCKIEAIANSLVSNELFVWRQICRHYSEKYSTPLHLCLDGTIPAEDILLAEFESQLDNFDEEKDLESLLDRIYSIEDPNYEVEKGKELNDFIKRVEKEEEERIRLGKPIHKAMKNEPDLENTSKKAEPEKPKKTGGHVNLSYLASEENQGDFER